LRACIVCFSQTSNTLRVAEAVQERLAAEAGSCALYRLEDADPALASRYDLVGLGTPVFYLREPLNVRRFFLDMPRQSLAGRPKPFFLFLTHGGTPADAVARIHGLAQRRGLATLAWFQCLGVDTFAPYAGRWPLIAAGHPDAADLAKARRFASRVVSLAGAYAASGPDPRPAIPGSLATRLASGLFSSRGLRLMERHGILPHKRIHRGRCTRCAICVQSCPQGIIRLDPFPAIGDAGCIYCYHCVRVCPAEAILCNWTPLRILSGHYLRQLLSSRKPPQG